MNGVPELLTPPEAAAAMRVDVSWIYKHWPELDGSKAGGIKIPVSGIVAYLEARKGRSRKGFARVASSRPVGMRKRRALELIEGGATR